jgi:dTDP-4-dehydrorhamnose reductase
MKRLLVTGASGFLGWNICHHAQKEFDLFGTVLTHPLEISGVKTLSLDLTNFNDLTRIFKEIGPDGVIHTAAASRPEFCQSSPSECYKINVEATVNLAGLCSDRQIPFAFTSTDLVFDGQSAPYRESDPVNPINIYGEQKALAEEKILNMYSNAVVCRMPMMFGVSSPAYETFFQQTVHALQERRELTLFTDEFRTPISGHTATQGLIMALKKAQGILHLGGRERISRYDFGKLIAGLTDCTIENITACKQKDVKLNVPRAADVTLDSTRAFSLGFNPPTLKEQLQLLLRSQD